MMTDKKMTVQEFERISKRLDFNLATRTNLLTISFTTVLATLALAFTVDLDSVYTRGGGCDRMELS